MEYTGTLSHLTARGNDQQTIVHAETDRADFLTRLGQEILPQRWCSAKSNNDTIRMSSLFRLAQSKAGVQRHRKRHLQRKV